LKRSYSIYIEQSANWQAAIDDWIGEVKDVVGSTLKTNGGVIGHYTQVSTVFTLALSK
jgi:hypothetical protein